MNAYLNRTHATGPPPRRELSLRSPGSSPRLAPAIGCLILLCLAACTQTPPATIRNAPQTPSTPTITPGLDPEPATRDSASLPGSECSPFLFDAATHSYWGIVTEIDNTPYQSDQLLLRHKVCRVSFERRRISVAVYAEIRQEMEWREFELWYEYDPLVYIAAMTDDGPMVVSPEFGLLLPIRAVRGGEVVYQRSEHIDLVPLALSRHQDQVRCYLVRDSKLVSTTLTGEVISETDLDGITGHDHMESRFAGVFTHTSQPKPALTENREAIAISGFGGFLLIDGVTHDVLASVDSPDGTLESMFYSEEYDSAVFHTKRVRGFQPLGAGEPGLFLMESCLSGEAAPVRVHEGSDFGQVFDCVFRESKAGGGLDSVVVFAASGCWRISPNGASTLVTDYSNVQVPPTSSLVEVCASSNLREVLFVYKDRAGHMTFYIRDVSAWWPGWSEAAPRNE